MNVTSQSLVRVRYAETDQMGVAWHGGYFAWFEVARTDLLRSRGATYRDLEERGIHLPVIEATASFLRPVLYDDVLEVRASLAAFGGVRMRFTYEVRRQGADQLLARGATEHATVNGRGRPCRLPEDIQLLLTGDAGFHAGTMTGPSGMANRW